MLVERRGCTIRSDAAVNRRREEQQRMTRSFNITKKEVWIAYQAVRANRGSAGVDGQSIEEFEGNLTDNLYKLWNRISSGSYLPPAVKRVEIPKSNGTSRPLGIPTVADRIAQTVIKNRLEPCVEPHFHEDSYGFRPGKSAHDAIEQAKKRCWRDSWVLDVDIKGFFESIDHTLLMKAVSHFTTCRVTLLYIYRWLTADVVLMNGETTRRTCGTPQGGVISPILANIFLHFTFDRWMQRNFPCIHFERYADDIVVHCRSPKQVEMIQRGIEARFAQCHLELSPEKTKVVYCKDSNRDGQFSETSFDFLGYTFRPRSVRDRRGAFFVSFSPAVSRKALTAMRERLRRLPLLRSVFSAEFEEVAAVLNPIVRGWINYYGKFRPSALSPLYRYLNDQLARWARRKFKFLHRRKVRSGLWLRECYRRQPSLFVHWTVWRWMSE